MIFVFFESLHKFGNKNYELFFFVELTRVHLEAAQQIEV